MVANGTRLGPYEIASPIGAGGMGEVYKARDTRLDRSVAIKILPAEFAQNVQLKLRFEREAKTISQLTHPNICTLYDVGDDYLVMEYLEGETLADRLARGALPMQQVYRYGIEICEALDCAHAAGVVHRDLKPGNVMLTKSGAKLLDFGLAKSGTVSLFSTPNAATAAGAQATVVKPLTAEGTIIGTLQYMAPEQLAGAEADVRTDMFALGDVLYEMATGHRAFDGKAKTSVVAAIMDREPPPITQYQPLTPPAFETLVKVCLAKDPDHRWQSARDVKLQLEAIAGTIQDERRPKRRALLAGAAIAVAALLIGVAAGWLLRPRPATAAAARLSLPLDVTGARLAPLYGRLSVAVSPDAKAIVYAAAPLETGGSGQLYLRHLNEFAATPISGTEGAYDPFFSPDGTSIAFFTLGKLRKVSVDGGTPIDLADGVVTGRGGTWAADGTIYYSPRHSGGIWRVPSSGGTASQITTPDAARGENSHRWPHVLPDGKHLIFTVRTERISSFDEASIAVLSLDTGKWTTLVQSATFGRYVPTGHLLFMRSGAIYSMPFDAAKLRVSGTPVRRVEGVLGSHSSGVGQFGVGGGLLAFIPGSLNDHSVTLVWVDHEGHEQPISDLQRSFTRPRLSPDGHKIVMGVDAANDDLWLYDIDRTTLSRFTSEAGDEVQQTWTPDGSHVVFENASRDVFRLMWKGVDTGGAAEELYRSPTTIWATDWLPDGRLVGSVTNPVTIRDIYALRLKPTPALDFLVKTPAAEGEPAVTSDGRWLAYTSLESGRPEVFVQSLAGPPKRWQISTDGGFTPKWSRDNTHLYFRNVNKLMKVDVTDRATLATTAPRLLFEKPFFACDDYDVALDNNHLLMCKSQNEGRQRAINIVTGWTSVLGE